MAEFNIDRSKVDQLNNKGNNIKIEGSAETERQRRKAELDAMHYRPGGQTELRKLYRKLTGDPAPDIVYHSWLVSEILDHEFNENNKAVTMDVILTWSGSASHEMAKSLRLWLREVIPGTEPWVSSEDIAKGTRWSEELTGQLAKTRVSISCITPENVRSPWIFYEAGFIAAKLKDALVCPFLIGVEGTAIKDSPLGLFQWTVAEKDDTWKLIKSINNKLGGLHKETVLEGNFDAKWPKLRRALDKAVDSLPTVVEEVEEVEAPVQDRLTKDAKELLLEASKSPGGDILLIRDTRGLTILTNNRNFVEPHTPRLEARWYSAAEELVAERLVRRDPNGSLRVTSAGFEVADILSAKPK